MEPELTEEQERFMRWLEEDDVCGHEDTTPPEWHVLRHEADKLGTLLRSGLPGSIEPPNPAGFNEALRQQLD